MLSTFSSRVRLAWVGLCPSMSILILATGLLLASCHSASSSSVPNWPRFRGAAGAGQAAGESVPLEFGPDRNQLWRTPLPPGHSSPCIWGDHLFVTAFAEGKLQTLALSRSSGEIRWTREIEPTALEKGGSRLGNPATSTPTTDGARVYVYFGAFGLLAYDLEGEEVWRKPLKPPITQHGASTSPILAGDRLILVCDQDVDSYVLAANPVDGETIWRKPRPRSRRGFSTPLAHPAVDPEVVIIAGSLELVALDLEDGEKVWSARGLPNEMVSSPVAAGDLILAAGWTYGSGVDRMPRFDDLIEEGDGDGDGRLTREEAPDGPARRHFPYVDANKDGFIARSEYEELAEILDASRNAVIAVRAGGRGDVTETHLAWEGTKGLPYIPTPVVFEDRLFLLRKGGIATCYDLATGKVVLGPARVGTVGNYYASPVVAGNRILVISERGGATWLRPGAELEVLATADLGAAVLATPAIVEGVIYVRTEDALVAFGDGR